MKLYGVKPGRHIENQTNSSEGNGLKIVRIMYIWSHTENEY